MYLLGAGLRGVAPFGDLDIAFARSDGTPRPLTVIHGGAGTGKTALVSMLASTRPGHAVVPASVAPSSPERPPHAFCDYLLGIDDLDRPHPLRVFGPSLPLDPRDEETNLRRREQALFDRKAKEGGFVFVAFPTTRWFSRQAVALHAPGRSVVRYDVRTTTPLDDPNRFDLARETKQALAYAEISAALVDARPGHAWRNVAPLPDPRRLSVAMRESVDAIVTLLGHRYHGLDPLSFEPVFARQGGMPVSFDALPTRARHLVAIIALSVRALWAAYPDREPREAEGVVAVDEVDLHQDLAIQRRIVGTLRAILPGVQWILTTSSLALAAACDSDEVLALRRLPLDDRVALFAGAEATTH